MQAQSFSVASAPAATPSATAGHCDGRADGSRSQGLAGWRRTAPGLVLLLCLGACGQKGALYLSAPPAPPPAAAASAAPLASERPPARSDNARTP